MFYISEYGNIQLTRANTARFSVNIENELTDETTGELVRTPYEIQPDDIVRLRVKENAETKEVLLEKYVTGSADFHILPEDTADWDFAKYVYDVAIKQADNDFYTVTNLLTFEILKGTD